MGAGRALKSGYAWTTATLTWGDPGRGFDYGVSYRSDSTATGWTRPSTAFPR